MADKENECCGFAPGPSYNDRRDVDATPLSRKMQAAIDERVGKPTSPEAGMGDVMPDKPFVSAS